MTWVALTKVVASGVPLAKLLPTFSDTAATAPGAKPVPLIVSVNDALPAVTLDGEMLVIAGTGAVMVNVSALDTESPLLTVTDADPCCAIRLAVTAAFS